MGKMNFDKIIVADLESVCWETKEEQGDKPMEIIEIGVCVLDTRSFEISRKKSYIVRPVWQSSKNQSLSGSGPTALSRISACSIL